MKTSHNFQIFQLLLATFFVSTAGVLGKHIEMPTEVITWFRSVFGAIALLLFCLIKKNSMKVAKRDINAFIFGGIIMGIHWVLFFYAVKVSNVAIAILSNYTFPIITSILEPIFLKTKFKSIHILLGGLVILGLYIIAPNFSLESQDVKGILLGVTAAFFYSIRLLIMKKQIKEYKGSVLMFYQTLVIATVLTPFLFIKGIEGAQENIGYLLLLGVLTTAIGHGLIVYSLKFFTATTSSIISSIQPMFSVLLAFIFLNEIPTKNTYIGGALILSTVIIESVRSKMKKN